MLEKQWKIHLIGSRPPPAVLSDSASFKIETSADVRSALRQIEAGRTHDLVLLDLSENFERSEEAVQSVHQSDPFTPIVLIIKKQDESVATQLLSIGAQDYVFAEDINSQEVLRTVSKSVCRTEGTSFIHHADQLLRALMDNIPDAVYFKDLQSRFMMISRAQSRKHGLSDPSQALGKTDADFFSKEHAEQALADEIRVINTGAPLVGIEEMETWPDGSVTWVSTTKMPLRDKSGRIIGTFGMSRNITEQKKAQQALAEHTLQLESHKRRIEEELKMARELQLAMLPHEFPCVPHGRSGKDSALEFFSFYSPSGAVSGDFFDVLSVSDTAVGVFICDVMGHDVRAALVTAMMRAQVADSCGTIQDPGELLARLNRSLAGVFKQTGTTMFATAFYMIADVQEGVIKYSSAAHPDPLHLQRASKTVNTLGTGRDMPKGPALGLFEDSPFPSCQCQIAAGDLILLFTDGLTEVEGPDAEPLSPAQLSDAVRRRSELPANELIAGLISEIQDYSNRREFEDDVCLVGMEIKQLGAR